jgi:hypothetical protein
MGLMVSEKLKLAPDASDTIKLSVNEGPVSVKLSDTVIVRVRVSLIADIVSVKVKLTELVLAAIISVETVCEPDEIPTFGAVYVIEQVPAEAKL